MGYALDYVTHGFLSNYIAVLWNNMLSFVVFSKTEYYFIYLSVMCTTQQQLHPPMMKVIDGEDYKYKEEDNRLRGD